MNANSERYYGLAIVSYLSLKKCSEFFKANNVFFSHTSKKHLSNFIETTKPIWRSINDLKLLHVPKDVIRDTSAKLGYEIESEIITEELNTQEQIVENLIDLLLTADVCEIDDLYLFLQNMKNKKKLYTEEELKIKLVKLAEQLNPVVKYDAEFFKQFYK